MPPTFQPELAAEAIVWAAEHRRREVWLGGPTYKVILDDFFGPAVADRLLARSSYEDQQTDLPISPDRPNYLYERVPGDAGAHGIFDDRAKSRSRAWAVSRHRRAVAAGAVAGLSRGR